MELFDSNWMPQLELAASILIASILGGAVGMERELSNRPAGLRTHAILAAAACLIAGMSDILVARFVSETAPSVLRADPIRVIEAIVTGVAFLGAGTIFRYKGKEIEGLTTAASLLLVAGIGIAVAMKQVLLAVLVTILALILLRVVRQFSKSE